MERGSEHPREWGAEILTAQLRSHALGRRLSVATLSPCFQIFPVTDMFCCARHVLAWGGRSRTATATDLEEKNKTNQNKTNQTKQNKSNKQTRGVDMQCRVCASVDCVNQVGVVLCDCDPLGGVLLICSLCGGKIEHAHG